ncbi:hypothetical protein SODALDRAFT_98687 [Sodiomyces alkalinus F11]|uniref:Alpha-1,3-mannosyltransferase n=1 Tax=Sodiomyces alkalinus (strain CBS 110278 / VKM F-3762 / F11) TaxID=1314773 RepID=A0A3N2Q1F3_SODAK|nr:hypothetical protein SODALDRAFT_98687 [Sodiomyces alkalinus F11]ROT40536.1 hypothetical protein SODALDRAFT_98687 [Sodiomyces alkalinus F11]
MPPHLHPRSRMTSSLFATTVFASFLVVGLPHILPCPAPRVTYADGDVVVGEDGRRRRRRRRETPEIKDGMVQFNQMGDEDGEARHIAEGRSQRECPVPKPGGILGEWLGFHAHKAKPEGGGGGEGVGVSEGNRIQRPRGG